jgi:hypothetical protein
VVQRYSLSEEMVLLGANQLYLKYCSCVETFSIGAIFIDLLLKKKIVLDAKGKVIVLDTGITGVFYMDKVNSILDKSFRKRNLKFWVKYFLSETC